MIYLYGLTNTPASSSRLAELQGVTGAVEATKTPCGWLIYGPFDGDELLPKRRHLLAHTRVLEAVGEGATVLPMRFGMQASSADEFCALVSEHEAEIMAGFQRLEGQVELGLRIEFPREAALKATLDADPALAKTHASLVRLQQAPHFEAAAFGQKLADALDRRRADAQRTLLDQLRPHLTDVVVKAPESDVQVLAVDVLVPWTSQTFLSEVLEDSVGAVAGFAPDAEPTIRIIGPVPPFSFVDLTLAPAEAA